MLMQAPVYFMYTPLITPSFTLPSHTHTHTHIQRYSCHCNVVLSLCEWVFLPIFEAANCPVVQPKIFVPRTSSLGNGSPQREWWVCSTSHSDSQNPVLGHESVPLHACCRRTFSSPPPTHPPHTPIRLTSRCACGLLPALAALPVVNVLPGPGPANPALCSVWRSGVVAVWSWRLTPALLIAWCTWRQQPKSTQVLQSVLLSRRPTFTAGTGTAGLGSVPESTGLLGF